MSISNHGRDFCVGEVTLEQPASALTFAVAVR
jgi:hypothetical protein